MKLELNSRRPVESHLDIEVHWIVSTGRLILGSARINLHMILEGKYLNSCPHLSLLSQILLKGHDVRVYLLRIFYNRVESDLGQKLGSCHINILLGRRNPLESERFYLEKLLKLVPSCMIKLAPPKMSQFVG